LKIKKYLFLKNNIIIQAQIIYKLLIIELQAKQGLNAVLLKNLLQKNV